MKHNIYLTGFMGSGKTTVGQLLAKKLNRKFFDLDEEIEKELNQRTFDIISKLGEEYFRELERKKLKELSQEKDAIIALGGGSLITLDNQQEVKKTGFLIYLMIEEEEALRRIKRSYKRPLLQNLRDGQLFHKLMDERMKGYLLSDRCISTSSASPGEIVQALEKEILKLEAIKEEETEDREK